MPFEIPFEIPFEMPFGLQYGWWFTVCFGLVNLSFLLVYPQQFSRRLFRFPPFISKSEKVVSIISVIVFTRGMMVVTIFVPFSVTSIWFYIGLAVYLAGLVFYLNALHQFATTRAEIPVVTGVYTLSRHPMQVFSLIMWLGVGIATTSHMILLICLLQPILMKPFLKCQERFCLTHYGEPYQVYLQRTPRYLFLV